MDVLIVIGDQDGYHIDEEMVGAPIQVSDLLVAEAVPALFVLQSRRVELWAEARRHDVVAAVRRHEVGLHGRDLHPLQPEIVETMGWDDGVAALLASERAELETLGRVLDRAPVCLSEHRGIGAPQLFAVAAQLGLPYLFGFPAASPLRSASWYAGALNVPFDSPVDGFLGFFPAVFDDALTDDVAFAALLARLQAHVAASLAAALPLLVVFVCHPERLYYAGPLERWQFGNGVNRERASVPPGAEVRRGRAEVERALVNLRRLVRYLGDAPELEPVSVADVIRRYGKRSATLSRTDLAAAAALALERREIVGTGEVDGADGELRGAAPRPDVGEGLVPSRGRMGSAHQPGGTGAGACSAAETLLGWAESLAGASLPDAVRRRDVLGPTEVPPLAPERPELSPGEIVALAGRLRDAAHEHGRLSAALDLGVAAIGLGSLYGVLAEAYLRAHRGEQPASVPLDTWPRYPAAATRLAERFRRCAEDPLARPGLGTDAIARHAALQTWTLAPATRRTS